MQINTLNSECILDMIECELRENSQNKEQAEQFFTKMKITTENRMAAKISYRNILSNYFPAVIQYHTFLSFFLFSIFSFFTSIYGILYSIVYMR